LSFYTAFGDIVLDKPYILCSNGERGGTR